MCEPLYSVIGEAASTPITVTDWATAITIVLTALAVILAALAIMVGVAAREKKEKKGT